jgi:hypothetical protein
MFQTYTDSLGNTFEYDTEVTFRGKVIALENSKTREVVDLDQWGNIE